jgi:predicted ATP-grasp superfamily ATP-dependent carboligase
LGRLAPLYVPFYFCLANAAALVAWWHFATGRRIERWDPVRGGAAATTGVSDARAGRAAPTDTRPLTFTRMRSTRSAPHAIVLGLDSATGLQSARILAARGVPVIGIASDDRHPCCRTRACTRVVRADTAGEELISALTALSEGLDQPAVLVPCTDLSVLRCSRSRADLSAAFRLVLPDADVIELLIDKARFYAFAEQAGFRVPRTCVLRTREGALAAADELPFPAIVKPGVKAAAWRRIGAAKGYHAGSPQELVALYDRLSGSADALIAQEWIAGPDTDHYTCNAYFGAGSEPLVTFTSRKLRQWPPCAGEACLSEEVLNEAVRDDTIRLFRAVRHRGLGYLEVKQRSDTGEYVILEPNAGRPTGRAAQAEASGVELLYTQHCDALGWPLPANRVQTLRNVKWIHLRRDVQASVRSFRRGELTLRGWARSWSGPKQDALFSLRDPVPFFADLGRATRKAAMRRGAAR